jgi:microcystin-dependent protein
MAERISSSKGLTFTPPFDTYIPELSDNADIQNAFELFYYGNSSDGNTLGDVSIYGNLVDFDTRITTVTGGLSGHDGATSDVHGTGAGNLVVGTGTIQTLTNKTLTSPVISGGTLNGGVALTVDSTELNTLDGITASTAELNTLDGITATVTELNYVDGVTSSIQTQIDTKSPSASPTFTGTVVLPSTTSIGNVSSTEIAYVDGVTSSIQTQINTNTPTGMISIHAGSSAPTGWLLCDGTSYASASYASLFGVVGYTFGGSGANFNVPNLKGRVVVGIDGAQTQFDSRGETGGAMTHFHASSNSGNTIPTTSGASDGNTTNASSSANSGNASAGNSTGTHLFNAGNDATTSSNSANHTHSVNPGETATTNDGSHNHTTTNAANNINAGVYATVMDNVSAGSHSHNVNIATFNSDNQSANHTHTVDDHYHNTADHSHTIGHTHTTPDHSHTVSHSHTTPASDIISNLQPYIALNYIIKI